LVAAGGHVIVARQVRARARYRASIIIHRLSGHDDLHCTSSAAVTGAAGADSLALTITSSLTASSPSSTSATNTNRMITVVASPGAEPLKDKFH